MDNRLLKRSAATVVMSLVLSTVSVVHAAPGRWVPSLPVKPQGQVQLDLFADGTAFAYNNNDTPFWGSSDFGETWRPLPLLPAGSGTPEVDFGSPGFGITRAGTDLFVTEDRGLTWKPIGSPTIPPRFDAEDRYATPSALEVLRSEKVVLAGDGFWIKNGCPVPPKDSYVWTSDDRGTNWQRTTIPFPSIPREVEFLDDRYGLVLLYETEVTERRACGHSAVGVRSSVLLTTDGGRSFTEIHSAYYDDEDPIWAFAMATPSRIVLGSQGGKILLSTNQGRSFREVEFLRNEAGEATNTNVGWPIDGLVFGTKKVGYAGTNGRGTWRTEDGGRTWFREPSAQSAAGLNIGDVAAAGPHRALAGGAHAVARRVTQ